MLYHFIPKEKGHNNALLWEMINIQPFDEIIISWNAHRPVQGSYLIEISIFITEWSDWIPYADWSNDGQHFYQPELTQGLSGLTGPLKGTGFRVRITANHLVFEYFNGSSDLSAGRRSAKNGASINAIWAIHANVILKNEHSVYNASEKENNIVCLSVPPISQWCIQEIEQSRICSPIATISVLQFHGADIDPLTLCHKVNDNGVYGIWTLNVAQAAHELGRKWLCYVARLNSFDDIITYLKNGLPVVVSIQGPLSGTMYPYKNGHILVIRGYDSITRKVLCMDPGFHDDEHTLVAYDIDEFMVAWGERRKGLAYVITKND